MTKMTGKEQETPAATEVQGLFGDCGPVGKLETRLSQQEVAAGFQVSRQSIHNWARDRGFPVSEAEGYRLADVLAWAGKQIVERRGGGAADPEAGEGDGADEANGGLTLKEKKLKAEIEKLQFDLERNREKFVSRAECEEQMAVAAGILSKRLGAVGKRFGDEVAAALEQALAECRAGMQRAVRGDADTGEGGEDGER